MSAHQPSTALASAHSTRAKAGCPNPKCGLPRVRKRSQAASQAGSSYSDAASIPQRIPRTLYTRGGPSVFLFTFLDDFHKSAPGPCGLPRPPPEMQPLPTERAPRGHRLPPAPAPPPRQEGHLQTVGLPPSSPHPAAFVSAAAHGPKLQGMKTLEWDPSCDLPRALGAPLPPWGAFPPSLDGRTSRWYPLFLPKPQG